MLIVHILQIVQYRAILCIQYCSYTILYFCSRDHHVPIFSIFYTSNSMFLKAVPKALLNKSQIFNEMNKLYGHCVDNILQIVDYNIRQGFRRFYTTVFAILRLNLCELIISSSTVSFVISQ